MVGSAMLHADQLLEEYLRVINSKDGEIHKLTRLLEEQRHEEKKREGRHKALIQNMEGELDKAVKATRKAEHKYRSCAKQIEQITRDNEKLKDELQVSQHKVIETEKAIEVNKKMYEAAVKEKEQEHHSEVLSLRTELEDLKSHQLIIRKERDEALKSLLESEAKANQIQQKEKTIVALNEAVETMRREMQLMIPAERFSAIVQEHEKAIIALKAASVRECDEMHARLSNEQNEVRKLKDEIAEMGDLRAQLQAKIDEISNKLEEAHRLRKQEHEEYIKERAVQQAEIEKAVRTVESTAEKVRTTTDQLHDSEANLQLTRQRCRELSDALEQERGRHDRERDRLTAQMGELHEKIAESKSEVSRLQNQLDQRVANLKECNEAFTSLKEESIRATAAAHEKVAVINVERDRLKEERDRLVFELKESEHQLSMEKERLENAKKEVSARLESANYNIERMRDQLKDKDHQLQILASTHEKRLQELVFEHTNKMGDCQTRQRSELDDVRHRLEETKSRLAEEVANNKMLHNDINTAREELYRIRGECERYASEVRGNVKSLEMANAEISSLRGSLSKQQELFKTAAECEKDLRLAVERANAQREMEMKKREAIEQTVEGLQKELIGKQNEIQQLQTKINNAHCEHVASELTQCEEKLRESKRCCEKMQQEIDELQHCRDKLQSANDALEKKCKTVEVAQRDAEAELSRLKEGFQLKESECARVALHARDVEDVTRRSCEQLEKELAQRDATVAALQQEAAAVSEERAKVAVLEERLQHQVDMSRRDVDTLQARVSFLEGELRDCEEKMQMKAEEMVDQFQFLQERAANLEEVITQKEKKHLMRKEALRKALQQVDEYSKLRAQAERNLEKVEALRNEELNQYKAEMQQQEEKTKALMEKQQETERQLALREREFRTVMNEQMSIQQRLAVVRDREQVMIGKHAEEVQKLQEKSAELERELTASRMALREADDVKENCLFQMSDVHRKLTGVSSRLLSTFTEDALASKDIFGDFVISFTVRLLRGVNQLTSRGCDSAATHRKEYMEEAHQAQFKLKREMEDLTRLHADEKQMIIDGKNKEIAKLVQQHGDEVARLRQELADVTARVSHDVENQLRDYRRKEDQFNRDRIELECAYVENTHLKEQIAALKDQVCSLEHKLRAEQETAEREKSAQQQQCDRVCHQLNECTKLRSKSEAEVRELHNEIASLQNALHEKEKTIIMEREKGSQTVYELDAVTTANEVLHAQLNDVSKQAQRLKNELATARLEVKQASTAAAAEQQRLEERISDLTRALSTHEKESRRLDRQARNEVKKADVLEKELTECRRRESELACQLQARAMENSSLRERCANLESLKNISDVTLAETRMRERDLFEKIEEMRNAQHLIQLCFDKQQEQMETGRRIHERNLERGDFTHAGID
uniref:Putative basal body component n=1 Tax=Trypanosoma congolense (strain IL3000) TaxID=1068625 RepID=G0USJ9_TRYCI|nr:putative basal body component [Trypanosoma congolense IL3000]